MPDDRELQCVGPQTRYQATSAGGGVAIEHTALRGATLLERRAQVSNQTNPGDCSSFPARQAP